MSETIEALQRWEKRLLKSEHRIGGIIEDLKIERGLIFEIWCAINQLLDKEKVK